MNAQETISAAIETLEQTRLDPTPDSVDPFTTNPDWAYIWNTDHSKLVDSTVRTSVAVALMVLHRTIDTQLEILRNALELLEPFSGMRLSDDAVRPELQLARAILGEES